MSDPSERDSLLDVGRLPEGSRLEVSFLSLTDADREEMLAAIGVSSVEELFRDIPAGVRFGRELDVPPALAEAELTRHLEELAAKNVLDEVSFLGAGIYDHYVPAVVDAVLQRGEFLTAYTPYQPEISQGVLQAIFEYQTAICELTGMDVSNASGYDGTTVAADACFVAKGATGRAKVVVTEATNPQVRQVVKTYARGFGLEVVEVPHDGGTTDPDRVRGRGRRRRGRDLPAAELLRLPRAGARPRRRRGRRRRARRSRTSTSSASACSRRPGNYGCALAIGEGQSAGNAMSYGGPHYGFLAARDDAHPPAARPDRRRDRRHRGQARLRAHAADARAAHPAREGDLEHHDQPDAARPRRARAPLAARPAGAARDGGDLHGARRLREGAARGARARARVPGPADVQGVRGARRPARRPTRSGRARERGVEPRLPARPRLPRPRRRAARRRHRAPHRRRHRPPRRSADSRA